MTMHELWQRFTTTRYARAIEEEILPHMRLQQAEVARLQAEIARKRMEVDQLRAEVARQNAEVDRLRAENRALLNSILGIAGVPPIVVATIPVAPSIALPATIARGPNSSYAIGAHVECGGELVPSGAEGPPLSPAAAFESNTVGARHAVPGDTASPTSHRAQHAVPLQSPQAAGTRRAHLATPTRRRSWQQIHRALEFAALQKREPREDPQT